MTEVQAHKLVAVILGAYPNQASFLDERAGRAMMAAFETLLSDIDYGAANAAVLRLCATSKRMPSPAEIRAAVDEQLHGSERSPLEAWEDVRKAIGEWGYMRTPGVEFSFADPLVHAAVLQLGWRELCESEFAAADRARFVQAYEDLTSTKRSERLVATLPGAAAPKRIGGTTSVADALVAVAAIKQLKKGTP